MTNTMLLVDNLVEGGRYIIGYAANGNQDIIGSDKRSYDVIYKCYIPNGQVNKVPEMSKYFFYNQLSNYNIKKVLLSSKECNDFLGDYKADYRACQINFEKMYC